MKRHKHSLSHYRLLTASMGELIPLTWYETLPLDSIQQSSQLLIRTNPLNAPVMHPCRVRIHHWFVPNRLLWNEWEDFITGGKDGNATPPVPKVLLDNVGVGSVADYLGVPTGDYAGQGGLAVSALPFRALNLIFNEHYRDQDLVEERITSLDSGQDEDSDLSMPHVSWEKDYFTTARPWPQKGDEIIVPIGTTAPVVSDGNPMRMYNPASGNWDMKISTAGSLSNGAANNPPAAEDVEFADQGLMADLSQATGISVNEFREAFALQRFAEARAMFGSRYVEYLKYCGVRNPSDARLQNPEYLGGGRTMLQFSEVLQTASDDIGQDQTPVGTLRGHGIGAMRTNRFRRFFEEHGIVMTLMSVVPKSIYTSALPKKWDRNDKEEYFQKELQHIGEEEIKNLEIQSNHSDPAGTFGYQMRYDSYRYIPSGVSAELRTPELNHWHMAREFAGDVALNQSFTDCVPTKRIFADTEGDPLIIMGNHSIQARRVVAKFPKYRIV